MFSLFVLKERLFEPNFLSMLVKTTEIMLLEFDNESSLLQHLHVHNKLCQINSVMTCQWLAFMHIRDPSFC